MSVTPGPGTPIDQGVRLLFKDTPPFLPGTGSAAYTLPNDAAVSAAGTVTALRAEVLTLLQVVRAQQAILREKGLLSPRGRTL